MRRRNQHIVRFFNCNFVWHTQIQTQTQTEPTTKIINNLIHRFHKLFASIVRSK